MFCVSVNETKNTRIEISLQRLAFQNIQRKMGKAILRASKPFAEKFIVRLNNNMGGTCIFEP